jgi:hypothetical protein
MRGRDIAGTGRERLFSVIFEAGLYDHDHGHHQVRNGDVAVKMGMLYFSDLKLVVV